MSKPPGVSGTIGEDDDGGGGGRAALVNEALQTRDICRHYGLMIKVFGKQSLNKTFYF